MHDRGGFEPLDRSEERSAWEVGTALQAELLAEADAEIESLLARVDVEIRSRVEAADAALARAVALELRAAGHADTAAASAARVAALEDELRLRLAAPTVPTEASSVSSDARGVEEIVEPALRPRWHRRSVPQMAVLVVVALAAAVFVRAFVAEAFAVPSASMAPELEPGDKVVVSKLSYLVDDPRRGDVVVFDSPGPDTRYALLVKRIVGLPGETVEARGGQVLVDGVPIDEPYLPDDTFTADFSAITLGPDQYWVMGDNRPGSGDSRQFGPVSRSAIVGEAVVRAWPPTRVSFF